MPEKACIPASLRDPLSPHVRKLGIASCVTARKGPKARTVHLCPRPH
jgi:hypothetical protein